MLLCYEKNDFHILFLNRSKSLRIHAGQVSLPGGSYEASDKNLLETAIRETEEETRIKLRKSQLVGELNEFVTNSNFHLSTYVFLHDGCPKVSLSPEHDSYFYAQLTNLQNKANQSHSIIDYRGKKWDMHEYQINGNRIWGVTGWVINHFFSIL